MVEFVHDQQEYRKCRGVSTIEGEEDEGIWEIKLAERKSIEEEGEGGWSKYCEAVVYAQGLKSSKCGLDY